jgi:hypothetical protein
VGKLLDKNVAEAEAVRDPLQAVGRAPVRLHLNAVPNAGLQLRWNVLAHHLQQRGGAHGQLPSVPFQNPRQEYLRACTSQHDRVLATVSITPRPLLCHCLGETNVLLSHVCRILFQSNHMHVSTLAYILLDYNTNSPLLCHFMQYHILGNCSSQSNTVRLTSALIYQINYFFRKTWFRICQFLGMFPKILLFLV